ncbi:uncharacterized protein KY384_005414 [Bacidia gigantensis]|uniref:uncharacterized protein n=1 Tax=Bacidia gigantensis TaxID=2732470 RepID=UPI001D04B1A5|nr:uncharacterized protein KY384_005414 [Bacidia gigantensis]KAG8529933.1 hypothetical protein KY384_005414 [Bacidia gigantensis]
MEYNPHPSSNLASILQTLSSYTPPEAPAPSLNPRLSSIPKEEYDPSQYDPSATAFPIQESQSHLAPASQTPPPPQFKPSKPRPPSSTKDIMTYPTALRHITTHLLPRPDFTSRIQNLIHTQHKHEREWHAGLKTLEDQLRSRDASRKKLDEVLAAVGGKVSSSADGGGGAQQALTDEDKEKEMRLYERKVWKAQSEMVRATEKELAGLHVPFFGEDVGVSWKGKEGELRDLKGRVVGLLEDLCGEDERLKG